MTAEEFLSNVGVSTSPVNGLQTYLKGNVITAMEQFSDLKVADLKVELDKLNKLIVELNEKAIKHDFLLKKVYEFYDRENDKHFKKDLIELGKFTVQTIGY